IPLSPNTMRRFGYRSRTAAPMMAERMLMRFIWNEDTPVNSAERRTRGAAFSRMPGGVDGNVWKRSGRFTSFTACQSGSQHGSYMGSMSHEHESSRPLMPVFATRCVSLTAASMSPYGRHARPMKRSGYGFTNSASQSL